MSGGFQRMVYVCIVSEHNLVELEACLHHRPSDVVLVVTSRMAAPAARLDRVLRRCLPGVNVVLLRSAEVSGDTVRATHDWIRSALPGVVAPLQSGGKPCYLNITGGTKLLSQVLVQCGDWERLEYKGFGTAALERFDVDFGNIELFETAPVPVIEAVRLYADKVETAASDVCLGSDLAMRECASAIWVAQEKGDAVLGGLFDVLEQCWSRERGAPRSEPIHRPWRDFAGATRREDLEAWLRRLNGLAPGALCWDDEGVRLPGGNLRDAALKRWKRWVCGDWLEWLIEHWLRHGAGLRAEQVARGVVAGQSRRSAEGREGDVVVLHRGVISVVEAKAGLPPGLAPKALEQQLSSLGERFGKTSKILLLAPRAVAAIRRERGDDGWQSFELRCRAARVALCTTRAQLFSELRIDA